MTRAVFAVPGDLDAPTGGYAFARRLLALLPAEGIDIRPLLLPGSYPHPSAADLAATARLAAAAPAGAPVLADGLAFGAMDLPTIAAFAGPVVALVHHPLGFEAGLAPGRREALLASERDALRRATRVVATSAATARLLAAEFGVAPERLTVAEPGTDPARRACGSGDPVRILAVGAVSPRKGYDILVKALADIADLPWEADIVGALDRDRRTATLLRDGVAASGLEGRVRLAGAVGEGDLAGYFDKADLFVSTSLFEGYGMGLAEALAHGLPIVASTGGAAAETVPDAAALKVPPGDRPALAAALRAAVGEAGLRRRLGEAAFAAGARLPRWRDTAATVARVLREVAR